MKSEKTKQKLKLKPMKVPNMDDKYQEFTPYLHDVLGQAQIMRTIPRAIELQEEAVASLDKALERASMLKQQAASANNEDLANRYLSFEYIIKSIRAELRMWILLKQDDPNAAWISLVDAQDYTSFAIRSHQIATDLNAINYQSLLLNIERTVFPPQSFMSIGGRVRRSRCSICDSAYGECDHIKGKPYMGVTCAEVIDEIEMREISLVENPVDKRCRIYSFSDENGMTRDKMTWRLIPKDSTSENQEAADEQSRIVTNQLEDNGDAA